jgi:hypothetical protein
MADRLASVSSHLDSHQSVHKKKLSIAQKRIASLAGVSSLRAGRSQNSHVPIPYSSFSKYAVLIMYSLCWNTDKPSHIHSLPHITRLINIKQHTYTRHARGGTIDQSKHSFTDRDTLRHGGWWWVVGYWLYSTSTWLVVLVGLGWLVVGWLVPSSSKEANRRFLKVWFGDFGISLSFL